MPEADAEKTSYNPFDLTKVWPHSEYPMIDVGTLELNKNADNYFQQIEQAAFSPSNVVPGIAFSPDKMLQARVFSYADAHRHRMGVHYESLPVNRPVVPVHTYNKDGVGNFLDTPKNPDAYYEPNSFGGPKEDPSVMEPPLKIHGDAAALQSSRRQRRLRPGPGTLQSVRRRPEEPALLQHRRGRWPACRRTSSSASSGTSRRCTRTMPPVSARRWPRVTSRRTSFHQAAE